MTERNQQFQTPIPTSSSEGDGPAPSPSGWPGWVYWASAATLALALAWNAHRGALYSLLPPVGVERAAVVLVVQEGDCIDLRQGMATWATRAAPSLSEAGIGLKVAVLQGDPAVEVQLSEADLGGLPHLVPTAAVRAGRHLQRMGVTGTPALLLVDADGTPVLGSGFEAHGLGPGVELATRFGRVLDETRVGVAPSQQEMEDLIWNP
jgi:hypothetical protein